jgi:hypothetical protein
MDPSYTSGELSTLATAHIFQLIRASTNHIEQRITTIECNNQELIEQEKQLQEVVHTTTTSVEIAQIVWVQFESTVKVVSETFIQLWPTFR